MRFFLIGFMGSGKSYWGKRWSASSGLDWFDLDEELEKTEGRTIDAIFQKEGELYFRKQEKKLLHDFFNKDRFILSCGGGTPCFFDNLKQMNRHGVVIYLKSSPAELAERLYAEKEKRPLLKDVPEEAMEQTIADKLEERSPFYQQALYHLLTRYLTDENFERIYRRHATTSA